MDKDAIVQEVLLIIRKYLHEEYRVLVFGSWARGDALPTSDIDIGILGEKKAPFEAMVRIRSQVRGIPTLRKIDVVDLQSVGERFRKSALEHAVFLDARAPA